MRIQIQINGNSELLFRHVQAIPRAGDYIALQDEEYGGESLLVKQVVIFATESEETDIAAHVNIEL